MPKKKEMLTLTKIRTVPPESRLLYVDPDDLGAHCGSIHASERLEHMEDCAWVAVYEFVVVRRVITKKETVVALGECI